MHMARRSIPHAIKLFRVFIVFSFGEADSRYAKHGPAWKMAVSAAVPG
jgi:hypothetical protein